MSRFYKSVKNKIVKPSLSTKFSNLIGSVISYNRENNKAVIEIRSAGKTTVIQDVPVMIHGRGVIYESIKSGDIVYLSCANESLFNAKVIGIADDNVDISVNNLIKSYEKKGEYLCNIEPASGESTPRIHKRTSSVDYHDYISIYCDNKIFNNLKEATENINKFKDSDVGIINPTSKSLIRIHDCGVIDIFSNEDIGVSIDPNQKTISFFGDIKANSSKWSVLSNNVQVKTNHLNVVAKDIDINTESLKINGECIDV